MSLELENLGEKFQRKQVGSTEGMKLDSHSNTSTT